MFAMNRMHQYCIEIHIFLRKITETYNVKYMNCYIFCEIFTMSYFTYFENISICWTANFFSEKNWVFQVVNQYYGNRRSIFLENTDSETKKYFCKLIVSDEHFKKWIASQCMEPFLLYIF